MELRSPRYDVLTRFGANLYSVLFTRLIPVCQPIGRQTKHSFTMANPKRKQSKRRSANRRAANAFKAPQLAVYPSDGGAVRPHRVNPKSGLYRGRQVLTVEV